MVYYLTAEDNHMLLSRTSAPGFCLILVALALIAVPAFAATLTVTTGTESTGTAVTAINFFYTSGTVPSSQIFTARNSSGAASITKADFTTNPTGYASQPIFVKETSGSTLVVGINAGALTNLPAKTYSGTLHIEAGLDSADLTLNLGMGSSGAVTATATSLQFASAIGGLQQQQSITLTGPSGVPVNYSAAVTEGANWISVSPVSGNTTANPTVTVTVTPAQLGNAFCRLNRLFCSH
jgi:hypothetical protein